MKGFGIEIKNNLLEPKHVEKMGAAVWLYMWLLDKMTSITEAGMGKILGGKPVKYEEVGAELGISERTYRRWVESLRGGGYIKTKQAPYGLVITIDKAHKRFGNKVEKKQERSATNGTSGRPQMAHLSDKNGTSNKTVTVDSNSSTRETSVSINGIPYKLGDIPEEAWQDNKGVWHLDEQEEKPSKEYQRFMREYYKGFRREISDKPEELPRHTVGAVKSNFKKANINYSVDELIEYLPYFFANYFYKQTGWSVLTFLGTKVLNQIKNETR